MKGKDKESPCAYCVRKDTCVADCFVYRTYLEGVLFDPRLVRRFIK